MTLNRPEAMNAVGGGMHEELEDFFYAVRDDTQRRGHPAHRRRRAFSAGGDVKGMAASGRRRGLSDAGRVGKLLGKAKRM